MMTGGPIQELALAYDSSRVAEKVQRRRRLFRGRLISLGITFVIIVVVYVWQRSKGAVVPIVWVSAIVLLLSAAWAAVYLVGYLRARSELADVGTGTAVRIARSGVEVAGATATWSEVTSIKVVKGPLGGSPRLELTRTNGAPDSVALDQITVHPATLDSTARAYSGGRFGVDLSALDT